MERKEKRKSDNERLEKDRKCVTPVHSCRVT